MLTKNDLDQIRQVVREEVKTEVSDQLLAVNNERLANVDVSLQTITKQIKRVNKRLTRVEKDVSYIVKNYDEEIIKTRKRLDRLEDYVGVVH